MNATLQRIRDAHQRRITAGGMAGAGQVFLSLLDPGTHKRLAAEALIYLRRNRVILIRQGRNHTAADAYWLARAAYSRRTAAELQRRVP